jgi:hypothetical protein
MLNNVEIVVCDEKGDAVCNLAAIGSGSLRPCLRKKSVSFDMRKNYNSNYIVLLDPECVCDAIAHMLDRIKLWACKVAFVDENGYRSDFSELSNYVHKDTSDMPMLQPPAPLAVPRPDGTVCMHLASAQGRPCRIKCFVQVKFVAHFQVFFLESDGHYGAQTTTSQCWMPIEKYPDHSTFFVTRHYLNPNVQFAVSVRYRVGGSESPFSEEVTLHANADQQSSGDVTITKVVTQQDRDKEGFENAIRIDDSDSEMETFPNASGPTSGQAGGPAGGPAGGQASDPPLLNVTCSVCLRRGHTKRSKACPGKPPVPVAVALATPVQAPLASLETVVVTR